MSSFVTGSARHSTVEELLDSFHLAASKPNLLEYFGCFYNSSSRFLGTDASENWTAEEFYNYAKPHFDTGKGWTYVPRNNCRKIDVVNLPAFTGNDNSDISNLNQIAVFDELLDSESFSATSRGSGTLIFDTQLSCWFILQYHLTFPIPNELAGDMCGKIAVFEKNAINKSAALKADENAAALIAELEIEGSEITNNKKKKGGKTK